jgi:oligopeptide/dipeptide ABC transporter ATP-binding protein
MTASARPTIAEPTIRRKLRRRPPSSIRNGRALMLAIAGLAFVALFILLLGVVVGARGAVGVLLPAAAVMVPIALVCIATVRATRTRQVWALALVVGWGVLLVVVIGYLIVTMSSRQPDPDAIFFAQLVLSFPLVLALASVWHFLRGARWFNGEWEKPLKAEESGARPIAAPLVAGGPDASAGFGPVLGGVGSRFGAYVVDAILIGIPTALVLAISLAVANGPLVILLGLAAAFVISVGYFPFFWTRSGQTPGMRLTHVRVVPEFKAGPITTGAAIRRLIVMWFGAAALYIGWLWVFVDARRKAWHDIAAGTIVVDATAPLVEPNLTAVEVAEPGAPAVAGPAAAETGEPVIHAIVAAEAAAPVSLPTDAPLVSVQGLKKHFPIYGGILRKQIGTVYAVDGVDFDIMPGETFSLVGESGCGKTTLGRTVIQLTPSTDGRVVFDGYELADVDPEDMRPLRRRMQIIFQDPFGSLNPRMPISDIIGEGLLAQGLSDRRQRDKRVEDALELVGLRREYTRRYPHEFSGGQRQRIGVARALALGPDFIVADEPVSALDVSIQSQVLNLLLDLKRDLKLTYLFISHNLSVVQYFSDRVAVMYLGKIAEIGTVEQLYADPRHPYTVALLSAIPEADPRRRRKRLVLKGDVPSPAAPPSGCRFHTRCWLRERLGNPERCSTEDPELRVFGQEGHRVACHFAEDISQTTVQKAAEDQPAVPIADAAPALPAAVAEGE